MPLSPRAKGLLCACITGFVWSILSIVVKVALQFASTETIVWFRFVVATTGLITLLFIFDRSQFRILKKWPLLAVFTGICLAINFHGFQMGIGLTSPSNAQVVIQGAPLGLVLAGVLFFKERPKPVQWVGLVISVIGLGLFFSDQLEAALSQRDVYLKGNLWLLLAIVTWIAYASFQKVLTAKGWAPQEINLILYIVAGTCLFPGADLSEFKGLSMEQISIMVYLGLTTLVAYGCLGVALKLAPASQVSMIVTCNPLLTLFFMEILSALQVSWIDPHKISLLGYVGAALVVAGVLLAVSQAPDKAKN